MLGYVGEKVVGVFSMPEFHQKCQRVQPRIYGGEISGEEKIKTATTVTKRRALTLVRYRFEYFADLQKVREVCKGVRETDAFAVGGA